MGAVYGELRQHRNALQCPLTLGEQLADLPCILCVIQPEGADRVLMQAAHGAQINLARLERLQELGCQVLSEENHTGEPRSSVRAGECAIAHAHIQVRGLPHPPRGSWDGGQNGMLPLGSCFS